jgi:hypothetical protein
MSNAHREEAERMLGELLRTLRAQPHREALAPVVELCEQLERSIRAFHLEAIRFRMFTLSRQLRRPELNVPPDALALFDALRQALEAAGFQTRSVTS